MKEVSTDSLMDYYSAIHLFIYPASDWKEAITD